MKVCHVTSSHNRYDGRIFQKQLSSLAKKYDCYLICCDNLKDEIKNEVKIVSTNKKLKNVYERLFFANRILKKKCLEINADVYQFHDPELLSLALYMKKLGKKVIFDSHEDYEALFLEREWIPFFLRKILQKIYIKKEKNILSKLDLLICAAEHIKEKLIFYNKNTFTIENFPILSPKINKINTTNNFICFAGNVDSTWNHDVVINSISNIKNIKYLIVGNYTSEFLKNIESLESFYKVELIGKVPFEEIKQIYKKSKIGIALCSYRPNVNFKGGSLGITKIFEYMMYGLPVIFTNFQVFEKINNEKQFGIAVNPYDAIEVKNAINYLLDNPKLCNKMGNNGRKLVEEKYNWDILEQRLFKIYLNFEK